MDSDSRDAGSFRDPSGGVYLRDGRVFRTVMPCAAADFEFVRNGGFIARQIELGRVVPESRVDRDVLGASARETYAVLEHPRLPFISYPYEWPFPALKAAAVLQLELSIAGLESGVMLSDASAYNIQFRGAEPIFIDSLSFRRYREGEYWAGHRQFCEQFLNPLLLRALRGIPYNAWYRGSFEGITTQELVQILPLPSKLSWNVLVHVVMQARLQRRPAARSEASRYLATRKLPLNALRHLLTGLRDWVAGLVPADTGKTAWGNYADDNSYTVDAAGTKSRFICDFVATTKPDVLWDIGCNTGVYAETALRAGAGAVVGFDFDQDALDQAFARARTNKLNFLPLFLDAANPAPSQGWAQSERPGLMQRANADAVLALALVHHLVITRNIPLAGVVAWLVELAPQGIIEFVQADDPMVEQLLSLRGNIIHAYSEEDFVLALQRRARIVATATVSAGNRRLYWFERH